MNRLPIIGEGPDRECGGCTACCKPLSVPELDKQPGVWCQHCEIGVGCGIQHVKPRTCQEFFCSWIMNPGGLFTDDDRPDRLRVLFSTVKSDNVTAPEGLWRAYELTPGALEKRRVREIIRALAIHQRVVMQVHHDGTRRLTFDRSGTAVRVPSQEPRIIKP